MDVETGRPLALSTVLTSDLLVQAGIAREFADAALEKLKGGEIGTLGGLLRSSEIMMKNPPISLARVTAQTLREFVESRRIDLELLVSPIIGVSAGPTAEAVLSKLKNKGLVRFAT